MERYFERFGLLMKTSFPRFLLIVVVALLSISVSIIIRRGTFFEIDLVEGYNLVNWGHPEIFISVSDNTRNGYPIVVSDIRKLNTHANFIFGTCRGYAPDLPGLNLEEFDHDIYFLMKINEMGGYRISVFQNEEELLNGLFRQGFRGQKIKLVRPAFLFRIISYF